MPQGKLLVADSFIHVFDITIFMHGAVVIYYIFPKHLSNSQLEHRLPIKNSRLGTYCEVPLECHRTPLMASQSCIGKCPDAVRQQAVT